MIGFSIMMWFCSALLIFVSFSLLKGNYSSVHGKVFETTNDRKGYAKALGKPVLLIGICLLFSGVIAVILPKDYAISIAVIFILFIAVICSIWLYKIQKDFRKFQLCAQPRVCSQAGGIPVYPRFSQPDNSKSWDDAGNGI